MCVWRERERERGRGGIAAVGVGLWGYSNYPIPAHPFVILDLSEDPRKRIPGSTSLFGQAQGYHHSNPQRDRKRDRGRENGAVIRCGREKRVKRKRQFWSSVSKNCIGSLFGAGGEEDTGPHWPTIET